MTNGVRGLVIYLSNFIRGITSFIIGLTLLVFVWGIFKLVFSSKDSKEREQAKGFIVWGIIALAIMVSVWGLVNLLTSSFGLGHINPVVPQFPNANVI
jgi:uncharacterized membrane protein YidH (DUF202 family)